MENATVLLDRQGPLAIVTLNRPDQLNAINWALARELLLTVQSVMADEGVRAVLLTGAGRGFCAGADLKDIRAAKQAGGYFDPRPLLRDAINPTVLEMTEGPKPVVCAVNGPAAGAGCSLAVAADLVLAGRSASFLQAFVRIGAVPDGGASWLLPRLVGRSRAMTMMMLGGEISAETAAEWGLVHEVHEDADLQLAARDLALRLAAGPPLVYAATKRMMAASFGNDFAHQLDLEAELQASAFETADFAEGVTAFVESRRPTFRGA